MSCGIDTHNSLDLETNVESRRGKAQTWIVERFGSFRFELKRSETKRSTIYMWGVPKTHGTCDEAINNFKMFNTTNVWSN